MQAEVGARVRIGLEVVHVDDHEPLGVRDEGLRGARCGSGADLQHDLGAVGLEPSARGEQGLPRAERLTRPSHVRCRLRDHGPPQPLRQERRGPGGRPRRTADHHDPAPTGERACDGLHLVFGWCGVRVVTCGGPHRLTRGDVDALRRERFVEGAVDLDGAGRHAAAGVERRPSRSAPFLRMLQHRGHRRLEVRPRVPAVEVLLVDRLVRAGPAQAWRPVGGQEHQRDARLRSLHDRGEQFGRRRPARREDGDGPSQGVGHAEREECTRAFVEMDMDRDAGIACEGERERRGARAG